MVKAICSCLHEAVELKQSACGDQPQRYEAKRNRAEHGETLGSNSFAQQIKNKEEIKCIQR